MILEDTHWNLGIFWVKTWEILNVKSDIRFIIDQGLEKMALNPHPQRDLHLILIQEIQHTMHLQLTKTNSK